MPISVQEIVNRATSALDAEGSDRYRFDQDFKPAINYAIEWSVSAFNDAFAQNKLSGESLKELNKVGIWQTNNFSRLAFDEAAVGSKLWTIIAIYPKPTVYPYKAPVVNQNPVLSEFVKDLSFVKSEYAAKRLTQEEWNDNVKNVFMPGNIKLGGELTDYAYLDSVNYSSTSYTNPGIFETEIRPSVANEYVAMAYLVKPTAVSQISDSVQFPESMTNIIVEKALNFISYKQGDGTNLYGVTSADINRLVALMR